MIPDYLQRVSDRIGAYAANDEPLAAAGNKVALVLAGNAPFYPLYVIALAGSDGMPWLLMTLLAFPIFLMVELKPVVEGIFTFNNRSLFIEWK